MRLVPIADGTRVRTTHLPIADNTRVRTTHRAHLAALFFIRDADAPAG